MKVGLTLGCLFALLSAWGQEGWSAAQKRLFEEGDFAFYQGDYAYAESVFDQLRQEAPLTGALAWRSAACRLERGSVDNPIELWLEQAVEDGELPALFYQGRLYHLTYRLDQAIETYTRYQQSGDADVERLGVARYLDQCWYGLQQVAHPVDVVIDNLGPTVNTEHPEYVPVIDGAGQELYFTSRRPETTARLIDPTGQYFEDIYRTRFEDGLWQPAQNAGLQLNSETHDATVSRSADGKQMLVYRTNPNLTGGDLYLTHKTDKGWGPLEKLGDEINSVHQEPSACLSVDGDVLIFASDRPGGYGGKDLYRVRRLPNGDWSLPRNLGPTINTEFDEDAPFLTADGAALYFASKGHLTMGGYDLFRSNQNVPDVWTKPANLGYPVNTVGDDIYLSLDASGTVGYFSSARLGGFGSLDLYRVRFVERDKQFIVMHGEAMDPSGAPVAATITVLDQQSQEVQGIYNAKAETGKFILVLNPLVTYKLFIEAIGYQTMQDEIYLTPEGKEVSETRTAPYILSPQR